MIAWVTSKDPEKEVVPTCTKIEDDGKSSGSGSFGSGADDSDSGSSSGSGASGEEKFEISYEKQLLPVPSNHSDQGLSILTVASAGISSADRERIFTMMIREDREGIINHNGASGTRFVRGALHYGENINAFGEIKSGSSVSGVDSMEHDQRRKARLNVDVDDKANSKKDATSDAKKKHSKKRVAETKEGYAALASLVKNDASSDAGTDEAFLPDKGASEEDRATPDGEEADAG